jgi:hypothetical protein
LLLSLALVSIIPYWTERREQAALQTYIELRLSLALAIDDLDGNAFWQEYKNQHPGVESLPLKELANIIVPVARAGSPPVKLPSNTSAGTPKSPTTPVGPPTPPTGVTLNAPLYEADFIGDVLKELNDKKLLENAEKASAFYTISISRWLVKRHNVLRRANPRGQVISGQAIDQSEPFLYEVDVDSLLNCNLNDIHELAYYELPKIEEDVKIARRSQDVELKPGTVSADVYLVTVSAEALLLFAAVYFYAFLREGLVSPEFPARGTLFGAFSRSRGTLIVFVIALFVPVIACGAVALASKERPLIAGPCLVAMPILGILIALQRRSYFTSLLSRPSALARTTDA